MATKAKTARAARVVRHRRIRKKLAGTAERPRLAVYRSLNHIYVQVIDDGRRHTLAHASSVDPELRGLVKGKSKREVASLVGELVATRAKAAGVGPAIFDRGGYKFHGRVQALAEAARKGGLAF